VTNQFAVPGADIFVSYRREDAAVTRRLSRWLQEHFGASRVFLDTSGIRGGERFPDVILDAIRDSKVVIAVIGPHWSDGLDDDADWVRRELREALVAGRPIVPVLVDDTPPPERADLPADLFDLADRQAVQVAEPTLRKDLAQLFDVLEDLGATPAPTTAFADVPKTARTERREAWDAPYDLADAQHRLLAALDERGIEVSRRLGDGDLLLKGGSKWKARLIGSLTGPDKRLPVKGRLRIHDRGVSVAIEILLEEDWGTGVLSTAAGRYSVIFDRTIEALRQVTRQPLRA